MIKLSKRFFALGMGLLLCAGAVGCGKTETYPDGGAAVTDTAERAVRVETLEDRSKDRECWLSVPDSELVINPFDFSSNSTTDVRQTQFFNRAELTIDIGVLDYSSSGKIAENVLGVAGVNPYGGHLYARDGFENGWRPDRLTYAAEYDSGLSIEAYDYFYDNETVVRNLTTNGKAIALWGGYAAGNSNFMRMQDGTFVYRRADGITVAIGVSCPGEWSFYNSQSDFSDGGTAYEEPDQTGVWCFTPAEGTEFVSVSVGIGGYGDTTEDVVSRAKAPYVNNDFVSAAGEREIYWNELLSRVPLPQTFELYDLESNGITASDIRSYYYRSWTMLLSNVLPENPNFPYRSLSLGKASMWSSGSPESKYSCVWESLYGTQMYAFVDPDIAWELCLGTMSTIPEDGNIQGESLPSNKAQTVWICYTAKNDREKLEQCVEPLTNYLNWRFENPRWILSGSHDDVNERDIDFVAAYLVDLKFMVKICTELGRTDDVAYWQGKADAMYANMCEWFFAGEEPVQRYFVNDGSRDPGTPLWVCKSLWCDELTGDALEKVLNFAVSQYDPEKAFAGFGSVKYDDWAYTLYGFVRNGRADIAADMVQALLRDIPRSGFIGELYNSVWRGTVCEGVRPSLFGAILMIDNVWLLNGFMYHEGGIGAMNLFDRSAGVSGIRLNGVEYSIRMDGEEDKYTVTANGTETEYLIADGGMADPI